MDKRALRLRIAELERIENRTSEQDGELKQLRRRLARLSDGDRQQVICDHRNAKFGDKFCRTCGEQISLPPRAAVAELVREILEEDYEISDEKDDSSNGNSTPEPDPGQLTAEWRAYDRKFMLRGSKKFRDRKSFDSATPSERKQELDRIGVTESEVERAKKELAPGASRRAVSSR